MLRRSRLSLVASLFLAALLGGPAITVAGPAAAGPVEVMGPAAVTLTGPAAVSVAASAAVTVAAPAAVTVAASAVTVDGAAIRDITGAGQVLESGAAVQGHSASASAAAPVVAAVAVSPRTTRLTSQFRVATGGPRAPPAAA